MTWLMPASIATACGVFMLFAVNLYLFIVYRQRFLGFWAAGWGVHALRYLSMIAGMVFGESIISGLGYYFFIILSSSLLLTGCQIFVGKRPSYLIFTIAAIIFLIAMTALLLEAPPFYIHVLVFGFLALTNISMGGLIIINRKPDEKIALLVGGLFILWGLHQADYPFLRPVVWFAPWGYLLTGLLALACSIGLLILYFERTQKELLLGEARFRTVADFTYGWEYWEDAQHEILYMSPSSERITGYSRAEFIADPGLLTQIVHPDDRSLFDNHRHGISNQEDGTLEFRIIRRDGAVCWIEHLCHPVSDSNGQSTGRRVSNRDITERKQAEEKIRQNLKEKETLLKEIHHRVKNNMAVISGLLYLMSDRIEDESMKGLFEESRQWIKSMALVHEKIYRTENLARIDFSDYINSLVHDLLSSYYAKGREITTKINVRDIILDINTAIPCGQIINELITNAMKYAFPEKTDGEISISFTKTDHVYTLIIRDNGIGLPEGFDHTKTNTLGLQLVDALTRQLRGSWQLRSDAAARQGTEVIITFREKDGGVQR